MTRSVGLVYVRDLRQLRIECGTNKDVECVVLFRLKWLMFSQIYRYLENSLIDRPKELIKLRN